MPAIAIDHATQALNAGAANGMVAAAGVTSTGRATPMQFPIDAAILIAERAVRLEWVAADEDGYHLHVHTPGGRRYRLRAVNPNDQT